jgi:hypothetical protein
MGLDVLVAQPAPPPLPEVLARLAGAGVTAMIAMIDGGLVAPGTPLPPDWREVRLRTPAGMLTLRRQPGGVRILVFGNADEALVAVQRALVAALSP